LSVDERQGLLAIFGTVSLMGIGIVSVAAVRIGGIAVRLDLGCVGAGEAGGAGGELSGFMLVNSGWGGYMWEDLHRMLGMYRHCMVDPGYVWDHP
jgi:hypothetical protein